MDVSRNQTTMRQQKLICITILILFISGRTFSQVITRIESVQSLYIEVLRDGVPLGSATGFIIKSNTQNYLITNWHVVTNKNPVTRNWLDPKMQISPNRIAIMQNAKILGNYNVRFENLTDAQGNTLYKDFKIGNEMVDVVAVPLKDTVGDIIIYPVNYRKDEDSLVIQPTDRVFVLGFPKGIHSAPFLPIWKSGLIASEPDIDQEGKPIIWLDIASYGGMSGSPVYLITDKLNYKNGSSVNLMGGNESFFMGVFSHGQDINVGALWKGSFLKKLFESLP